LNECASRKLVRSSRWKPQAARCVELPCQQKQVLIDGIELGEYGKYPLLNQRLSGFRHLAGQPPEVRKAFVDALGLER
jgi:hypothetical protein